MTRQSAAGVALLALLFALPYWIIPAIADAGFWQHVFVTIFVYAAMASAWNIVGGFAGQLSLGHTIFYGIGAYTAVLLNQHFGIIPWFGMIGGAAISAVAGVLVSWPCLRLRGPFYTLSTVAFLEVVRLLAIHFKDFTGGSAGVPVPMFATTATGMETRIGWAWMLFREKENTVIIAFGLMVLCIAVSVLIRRSRFGYSLLAVREREDAAQAVGVNTTAVKLGAVAVSAALTSLVGSFHGIYLNFIEPETMFSLATAIQLAMFALIGGLGTVAGPIAGTLLVVPIAEAARGWLGAAANGLHGLVYGIVLVGIVLTMPQGLVGRFGPRLARLFGTAPPGSAAPAAAPRAATPRPPIGEPILDAKNLTRRFGGLVATNDVSVTLRQGEVLGIIGPNGAGKTTLFNLLSGFLPPNEGSVRVRDAAGAWTSPGVPHEFATAGVGRTFQIVQPFAGLSVRENIMLGAFHHARTRSEAEAEAERVAAMCGLSQLLDLPARSLTVGGAKRLEVARALAMRPRILLLDEVMAGLNPSDVTLAVELVRTIRDSGVSIIAIEHVMAAIMAISDRIVVINSGRVIAEGSPEAIAKDRTVIEAYLGEEYVAASA
jgi:branched-chain amino acid transport system permease protein